MSFGAPPERFRREKSFLTAIRSQPRHCSLAGLPLWYRPIEEELALTYRRRGAAEH